MNSTFHIPRAIALGGAMLGLALTAPGTMAADKVEVCHKGTKTISISRRALPAHEAHGDTVGECPDPLESMRALTERLLLTCTVNGATHDVTAASMSTNITADLSGVDLTTGNCANALQVINAASCEQLNMSGTPDSQTYTFACPSADDDALLVPPA